jgi:hypothetical protein
VKNREDFAPNFQTKELDVLSQQNPASQFLFHQGILTKSNMTVIPHPSYFSFSPVEDNTERLPFLHN